MFSDMMALLVHVAMGQSGNIMEQLQPSKSNGRNGVSLFLQQVCKFDETAANASLEHLQTIMSLSITDAHSLASRSSHQSRKHSTTSNVESCADLRAFVTSRLPFALRDASLLKSGTCLRARIRDCQCQCFFVVANLLLSLKHIFLWFCFFLLCVSVFYTCEQFHSHMLTGCSC